MLTKVLGLGSIDYSQFAKSERIFLNAKAMPSFAMSSASNVLCRLLLSLCILVCVRGADPPAIASDSSEVPVTIAHSKEKIALLHLHDGAYFFKGLGQISLSNKARYAARHGYELVSHTPSGTTGLWASAACDMPNAVRRSNGCFVPANDFNIDARAPTFGKIKLARAACKGRSGYWLLWTDADALVVNQTVPLTTVIDDRFDVLVSADWLMINAGMMLFKCTDWTAAFLDTVYAAREFDKARALDQSAFQHHFDSLPDAAQHVGYAPKHKLNVYVEEYRPGDFLLHMAGKLYEATVAGATAIAMQFDLLSMIDDIKDIRAFFDTYYMLNYYSGICTVSGHAGDSSCKPTDPGRLKLNETLGAISSPDRYRHVGMRYYWLQNWKDKHDTADWDSNRAIFNPAETITHSLGQPEPRNVAGHEKGSEESDQNHESRDFHGTNNLDGADGHDDLAADAHDEL